MTGPRPAGSRSPAISVVTPIKGRWELLRETMDSVRDQTLPGWEHIVVDDGSDEVTVAEVAARAAADSRIRYVRRESGRAGANVCRNIGIQASRAPYVVFLDSDDLLAPRALDQRLKAMEEAPELDFVVFPCEVFTDTIGDLGQPFSSSSGTNDLDRFLLLDHPWPISGPTWRRSSLERLGLLAEDLPSWQDVELNIRALAAGASYRKFDAPDHYVRWRRDPERTSVQQFQSSLHLRRGLETVQGFHARLVEAGLLNRDRRRALGGLVFLLAERWAIKGSFGVSIRTWHMARKSGYIPRRLFWTGVVALLACRSGIIRAPYDERLMERFKVAARFRE